MFEQFGRTLLTNGYQIVPIKQGEKRPAISGWQNSRIGPLDVGSFPGCGIGILTGQGQLPILGVDIDISHPVIGPAIIDWCHENLGWAPERVGAAPRVMLVYRAAETGWAKGNSATFFDPTDPVKPSGKRNEQQIEILGMGQQFVAYHIHPDTLLPYEWVDMLGGLEHVKAHELPVVTEIQIEALFMELDRLVRSIDGLEAIVSNTSLPLSDGDWLLGQSTKAEDVTLEDARGYLEHLDNTIGVAYDQWIAVGMALHHQFDGAEPAMRVWAEWSSVSPKHEAAAIAPKWRSFGKGDKQVSIRWLIKIANTARKDAESAARREVMESIVDKIAGAVDKFDLIEGVAQAVKDQMPASAALRAEVFSKFQLKFKQMSGGALLPLADVRRMLVDPARVHDEKKLHPMSEFGNAARMVDTHGRFLRYVHDLECWYMWTGNYWKRAANVEIEYLAKHTIMNVLAKEIEHHTGDTAAEFYAFMSVSQSAKMVKNMVSLAASDPLVTLGASDLDKRSEYIGVLNGVLHLPTRTLLPADPLLYITKQVACNYNPNATAPLFEQTMREAYFDDPEMVRSTMSIYGYMLQGVPKEDVMVIPFGGGSNGKSSLFSNVKKMMGGYAKSADSSSFISDGKGGGSGGAREDLVRLQGSRMVLVTEPDDGGELREAAVKAMTGGDAINARGMYAKVSVEIEATWVVFMPTNHKPIIKGTDDGIWRRMLLLPFMRNFNTDKLVKKDLGRRDAIGLELEGIFKLCVDAGVDYLQNGLYIPASIRSAGAAYRSEMDILGEWIEIACEVGPEHSSNSLELWQSFEMYAKNRGLINQVKSAQLLGRRLESRFPAGRSKKGARIRTGIAVKSDFLTDLTSIDLFL